MLGPASSDTATISFRDSKHRLSQTDRVREPFLRHYTPCTAAEAYPSPPMSRPPSPTQQVPESSTTITTTPATASLLPSTTFESPDFVYTSSDISNPTPLLQTPSGYRQTTFIHPNIVTPILPTSSQPSWPSLAVSTQHTGTVSSLSDSIGFVSSSAEASSSARPARRAKAHVASACVNCKRAHLSCDVQRPCRRCVDSGKEDTCYDVQHKKRGRPRLREENEAGSSSAAQQQSSVNPQQISTRSIASTRTRRANSYRSHQSHGSESSSYDPRTPLSATYMTYQPMVYPASGTVAPVQEMPTAFLDLDLVILRANRSFQQAVAALRDLTRMRLADVVMPLDGVPLVDVRNRLRGEREQREPSFLPPIMQTGQDPLANIQDVEAEQLTQGYATNTYMWAPLSDSTGQYPLTARVRLARAATYFAVVTLPFQRMLAPQHQSPVLHDPSSMPSSASRQTQPIAYALPQQYSFLTEGPAQPQRYHLRSIIPPMGAYPSAGHMMQTYQPAMVLTEQPQPSQNVPLVPMFAPAAYQQHPPSPGHMQLAPQLPLFPTTVTAHSSPQYQGTTQPESQSVGLVSSGEEVAEGAQLQGSSKRRRMGIDEVLQ